jgi:hypothetical protein
MPKYDDRYLDPKLRELWLYDPVTGRFTSKIRTWGHAGIINIGDPVGVLNKGYWTLAHHGKNYRAHVVAWVWMTGSLPSAGREIDHKNRIRADNTWTNLRLLDHGANTANAPRKTNNTTGVTGVYPNRVGNWFAVIYVDKERVHLGTYPTIELAIAARKRAEAIYWELQAETLTST